MAQIEEEEPDLSHIHWSWPEAIAALPTHSLATADQALDYFASSPFWDTKSNNNVLRTQRRVENPTYGHAQEKLELPAFTSGFEYVVAHALPPDLFVVHRREVGAAPNGTASRVSGVYFILEGKVYPTPTLHDVFASRLRNATYLLEQSFSSLSAAHPSSNPRATSQWRSLPPVQPQSAAQPPAASAVPMQVDGDDAPEQEKTAPSREKQQQQQPDWNLFHALQSTRASLASLDEAAKKPAATLDPRAELRALEASLLGPAPSGRHGTPAPSTSVGKAPGAAPIPFARAASTSLTAGLGRQGSYAASPSMASVSVTSPLVNITGP